MPKLMKRGTRYGRMDGLTLIIEKLRFLKLWSCVSLKIEQEFKM